MAISLLAITLSSFVCSIPALADGEFGELLTFEDFQPTQATGSGAVFCVLGLDLSRNNLSAIILSRDGHTIAKTPLPFPQDTIGNLQIREHSTKVAPLGDGFLLVTKTGTILTARRLNAEGELVDPDGTILDWGISGDIDMDFEMASDGTEIRIVATVIRWNARTDAISPGNGDLQYYTATVDKVGNVAALPQDPIFERIGINLPELRHLLVSVKTFEDQFYVVVANPGFVFTEKSLLLSGTDLIDNGSSDYLFTTSAVSNSEGILNVEIKITRSGAPPFNIIGRELITQFAGPNGILRDPNPLSDGTNFAAVSSDGESFLVAAFSIDDDNISATRFDSRGEQVDTQLLFDTESTTNIETAGIEGKHLVIWGVSKINFGRLSVRSYARLSVDRPPEISEQPSDVSLTNNNVATFSVRSGGSLSLSYQWFHEGSPIPNATSRKLEMFLEDPSQLGEYEVEVSNRFGSARSEPATLSLDPDDTGLLAYRFMPRYYWPGRTIKVTLHVEPPEGALVYAVEDNVPEEEGTVLEPIAFWEDGTPIAFDETEGMVSWLVTNVSNGGVWDSTNKKVKFGPFFDSQTRNLTYELVPPFRTNGTRTISGELSVDGNLVEIGSQGPNFDEATMELFPLHPADVFPAVDGRLEIFELAAYVWAWKEGLGWPVTPDPIPIDYLARAAFLWKSGEYYKLDPESANAIPESWIPDKERIISATSNGGEPTMGKAQRRFVGEIVRGGKVAAQIEVTPDPSVSIFLAEEQVPPGWVVDSISDEGVFDSINQKIKWGPFLDNSPRTLNYMVTLPKEGGLTKAFQGSIAFDGTPAAIEGIFELFPTVAVNLQMSGMNSQNGFQFNLVAAIGTMLKVQSSDDLKIWKTVGDISIQSQSIDFSIPSPQEGQRTFYRLTLSLPE